MRLHEAAPKLIIQERVGDKVKISSYWPVPLLTRAGLALGQLQATLPSGMGLGSILVNPTMLRAGTETSNEHAMITQVAQLIT